MSGRSGQFAVRVAGEFLTFSAAHFIVRKGFRESLHGHNYELAVTVEGALGPDGYVVDFGLIRDLARRVCAELDERTLIPTRSDAIVITERGGEVELTCQDGARFVLPCADVLLLPLSHTSAEELARYVGERLAEELRTQTRGALSALEVSVAEAPGQAASCRVPV